MRNPTPFPRPPVGSSAGFVQAWNQMQKCIEERTLLYVEGGEVDRKVNGYAIRIKPRRGVGSPGEATDWWQGEWRPDQAYDKGQVVVIRGGVSEGLYIADEAISAGVSPADPSSGYKWVSMAPGHTRGKWT